MTRLDPWGPEPAAPERRVLIVSGSPRRGGNTDTILKCIASVVEDEGIATRFVRLCDLDLHPCTGCEACRRSGTCTRFSDGMNDLYPEIERARGLVVGSPTYNYTITAETKIFIDRLYPYFDFTEPRPGPYVARLAGSNRKLVTVGVCEQREKSEMRYTLPVMNDALSVIGYDLVAELAVTGHFAAATVAGDGAALDRATGVARSLARAIP